MRTVSDPLGLTPLRERQHLITGIRPGVSNTYILSVDHEALAERRRLGLDLLLDLAVAGFAVLGKSVEDFGEHWATTQQAMLGDAVEVLHAPAERTPRLP